MPLRITANNYTPYEGSELSYTPTKATTYVVMGAVDCFNSIGNTSIVINEFADVLRVQLRVEDPLYLADFDHPMILHIFHEVAKIRSGGRPDREETLRHVKDWYLGCDAPQAAAILFYIMGVVLNMRRAEHPMILWSDRITVALRMTLDDSKYAELKQKSEIMYKLSHQEGR